MGCCCATDSKQAPPKLAKPIKQPVTKVTPKKTAPVVTAEKTAPVVTPKKPSPRPPSPVQQESPSGVDLAQIDYPDDEQFDEGPPTVHEIFQGIVWYASFQIELMQSRKKSDKISNTIIKKLQSEIAQTEYVLNMIPQPENGDDDWFVNALSGMDIQQLSQLLGIFLPIVKLDKGDSYLLGTEVKQISARGENVMVRAGAGYMTIESYYNDFATKQAVQLFAKISSSGKPFETVVVELLYANNANQDIINAYLSVTDDWLSTNQLFAIIATYVEQAKKEARSGSPKKRKASKKGKAM